MTKANAKPYKFNYIRLSEIRKLNSDITDENFELNIE